MMTRRAGQRYLREIRELKARASRKPDDGDCAWFDSHQQTTPRERLARRMGRLVGGLDAAEFAERRLGVVPDAWQREVLTSDDQRLILCCSRQAGKSSVAAILTVYTLLSEPGSLVLMLSPSQRQSTELFRKAHRYLADLGLLTPRQADAAVEVRLPNQSRLLSLPGKEATVRGFSSVKLLVEDEASRVADDLYAAIRPMLAVSRGRHLMLSTPYGQRGHFYETWDKGDASWRRITITADQCPRISPEFLAAERAALGDFTFEQEYMCLFHASDALLFNDAQIAAVFGGQLPV